MCKENIKDYVKGVVLFVRKNKIYCEFVHGDKTITFGIDRKGYENKYRGDLISIKKELFDKKTKEFESLSDNFFR